MKIKATLQVTVETTETVFTDQVRSEINTAIAKALHGDVPAYAKQSFVHRFNLSNGARSITNWTLNCEILPHA